MRVKIEITGETEAIEAIKDTISTLLKDKFDTYKFIWEEGKGH